MKFIINNVKNTEIFFKDVVKLLITLFVERLGNCTMQAQSYIRHPSEVPVQIEVSDSQLSSPALSQSKGTGVFIHTAKSYPINSCVEVKIRVQNPDFVATGYVDCCEPVANGIGYQTGIVFNCPDTAFAVRMIEQICHIEQYRQQVSHNEGRELSVDNAAQEWISLHAADFPELTLTN